MGKGIWKFNTHLLKDMEYINLINKSIQEEMAKYAVPVYNLDNINEILEEHIDLTISEDLFLEMLVLRMRGETIKFSSYKKKEENKKEKQLLNEIEQLEKENYLTNSNILDTKKQELIQIRETKMKGHYVRSRVQWLHEGERPTQFFCSLEHHNFVNKTVKKIKKKDGTSITNQKDILSEIKNFYSQLFQNHDHRISDVDLHDMLKHIKTRKLTSMQAKSLEGDLKLEELAKALKNMKNNKTPGIDGFPAEFFKVFWKALGIWILRALNCSFRKGTLSLTQRQCILTCLPKKGKPREYIRNWHPLSMLTVIYKLASAAIANRIKPVLDTLISCNQNGFVPGRYIGESTRLIYDIMNFTENHSIPGLLMLIDFEKAYDSISWKFMYKVLSLLGFTNNFISWIKLFNTGIHTAVIQNGFLSEFIPIERGCRQGDPISAYLFIMVAEILTLLIMGNDKICGIQIKGFEFKCTQFADDTTLILDGTQQSLESALNTLEIFGSISGLKMNTDKTKIIWIGKQKNSNEKLISKKFKWNETEFNLLGLKFSVDLSKMLEINYAAKMIEIKESIKHWNKRLLTPLGKVTVIKTFLLSKLNHIFLSLPNPDIFYIKDLNEMFFQFIWSNKPEKISRRILTLDYKRGGIKMVDLDNFITALKVTWLRRVYRNNSPWVAIFQSLIVKDTAKFQKNRFCLCH